MPKITDVGTRGAANEAIGGVPTLHYLDFLSRGRGQVLRLLFEDAGIAYKDIRYPSDEFPKYKATLITDMNPTGNVPVIELNGKILTQSYAILRHFARLLGKYDGETEDERYWVDAMCDIGLDWRTYFVAAFFGPNSDEEYPKHKEGCRKIFLEALNRHLGSNAFSKSGPFVIGSRITYADLVIYQICHDENLSQDKRETLKGYPRLNELVEAVEGRENIKKFLQSERYLG